jgi:hypothetical protein
MARDQPSSLCWSRVLCPWPCPNLLLVCEPSVLQLPHLSPDLWPAAPFTPPIAECGVNASAAPPCLGGCIYLSSAGLDHRGPCCIWLWGRHGVLSLRFLSVLCEDATDHITEPRVQASALRSCSACLLAGPRLMSVLEPLPLIRPISMEGPGNGSCQLV